MNIEKIFGDQPYSILVDSAHLHKVLKNIDGVDNIFLFDTVFDARENRCEHDRCNNFVFLCTKWDSFSKYKEIKNTRILLLPQVAFNNDSETAIYSVREILNSDFEYAVKQHLIWYSIFSNAEDALCFLGKESHVTCTLSNSIRISTISDVVLEVGDPRSVAEYFEISLENSIDETNSFIIDGYLSVEGILIAKGIDFNLKNYNKDFLENIIDLVNRASDMKIFIQKNRLISVLIDSVEYLNFFVDLVGKDKKKTPNIMEFAVGFNYRIKDNISWRFNSQVNEGLEGIHIGIGDGQSGFHLDFVTSNIGYKRPDSKLVIEM